MTTNRDKWFRRSTWLESDRSEFLARLARCRGEGSKAQHIRIQAHHLAETGVFHGAIELLEKLFSEYPEKSQLAMGHVQMAECRLALGQDAAALAEYRLALTAERAMPNVRTQAWLEFPWLVATCGFRDLYPEACRFLEWGQRRTSYPIEDYKLATVEAFMADDAGNREVAARFARIALAAAERTHSGLRYHAELGLVRHELPEVRRRLEKLAQV